jgi:hypothetical protein
VKAFLLLVAADTRRTQLHDERLRQREHVARVHALPVAWV